MLGKLNPFSKKSKNPLEQLSVDELRMARVKLERSREKTLNRIRELEEQKNVLFEQGVHADPRTRLDLARRIKEAEEQIRNLDQQLVFFGKQIQIINRLSFLKENTAQLVELGIDQVLGQMDTGELRHYVDEISLKGAVDSERLTELANMLDEALGAGVTGEEDPEISRLLAEMERAALGEPPQLETPESEQEIAADESEQEPPLSLSE